MKRAFLVAQREYLENIRTKGFWLSILMMPVMLFLIGIVPIIVESTREAKKFAVIDKSGWLMPLVQQQIEARDLAFYLNEPVNKNHKTPLDSLKGKIADYSGSQINDLSFRLANPGAQQENITFESALPISNGDEISRWWQSLSNKKKSKLSPRISSNRYLLVENHTTDTEALKESVQAGELFAYFVIGANPVESSTGSQYVSNNLTDRDLLNWFGDIVSQQVRQRRLKQENMDPETAAWLNNPITFDGLQISADGSEESVDSDDVVRQWAPVVFVYLLWISILINTQMLLTNTIEEKSNKLIEVLLSSVSPLVLMAGKIMGIAATGLTIIFSWALMSLAFFILLPKLLGISLPVDLGSAAGDPWFLGSFIVYFLLGYLLYAAILVGLGSVCNNLKEAQNLMLPVQLVQMLPILMMIPIGRDPNGTLAQILSYVPPLTPFVMMNRAAGPPSTFEYVSTTLLLVVSIIAALWVAAKIFRIGILLTGKPPGFIEIMRWIRAPVTQQK